MMEIAAILDSKLYKVNRTSCMNLKVTTVKRDASMLRLIHKMFSTVDVRILVQIAVVAVFVSNFSEGVIFIAKTGRDIY